MAPEKKKIGAASSSVISENPEGLGQYAEGGVDDQIVDRWVRKVVVQFTSDAL